MKWNQVQTFWGLSLFSELILVCWLRYELKQLRSEKTLWVQVIWALFWISPCELASWAKFKKEPKCAAGKVTSLSKIALANYIFCRKSNFVVKLKNWLYISNNINIYFSIRKKTLRFVSGFYTFIRYQKQYNINLSTLFMVNFGMHVQQ